jgi:drug/metabolite transporter (DMT)-like permease
MIHSAPSTRVTAQPQPVPGPARPGERQGLAILMICFASLIFACQDAFSRQLAMAYPPIFVTMVRYWFFAMFVLVMASRGPGGLRAAVRSHHPVLQILRGLLLVLEIVIILVAFVKLGLIQTHAVFTAHPLLVVALSGPVLGERIGWRRWAAVAAGFVGILIILQPGVRMFSPWAILPLISALMFAIYALLTRLVSARDSAQVSFFWTGIAGVVGITALGIWQMEPIAREHWPAMAGLCVFGATGHYLLIRAYSLAEASSLQPFSYTQLVWVSIIGVVVLGERIEPNVALGMLIIVGAGLFTWWRSLQKSRAEGSAG